MLDELLEAKYFSKLYLRLGYYQTYVRLEDVENISFKIHKGHYEFRVNIFGLTNAPTVTIRGNHEWYFWTLPKKIVLVFFDGIIIYNNTWKEHIKHLEQALLLLEENQFYAKISKCTFGKE